MNSIYYWPEHLEFSWANLNTGLPGIVYITRTQYKLLCNFTAARNRIRPTEFDYPGLNYFGTRGITEFKCSLAYEAQLQFQKDLNELLIT